jgi:hypothetical protein
MASLGAGAASAQAIFDSGRDLVCGSRAGHCCMDLRGPSNGWLIRYGLSLNLGSPAGASGFCKLMAARQHEPPQARPPCEAGGPEFAASPADRHRNFVDIRNKWSLRFEFHLLSYVASIIFEFSNAYFRRQCSRVSLGYGGGFGGIFWTNSSPLMDRYGLPNQRRIL